MSYWFTINVDVDVLLKQVNPTREQSIINLYDAALWMKAAMVSRRNTTSTASLLVDRCHFVGNERAMTLVGPFHSAAVYRSSFVANRAIHAGAGILVLVTKNTDVIVDNCTFVDNSAGQYREFYAVGESSGMVRFVGDEVHLNTACCKGVVMMVGKGGAMRIQRGNVTLLRSVFINNSARLLGGSVFVDIACKLNISGSHFENSPSSKSTHALQGDILYSDGYLAIDDVSMVVRSASNGMSVFRHSGDHWSLTITNVWVQCPVGYDLRTTNSSAYGVSGDGLRRSYQLDQLSYYCESCPRNKYSLDYGYLNYTITSHDPAYFALLINGSTPRLAYTGKFVHHKINCADCPHGGQCIQGITPVHDYWGYVSNVSVVRFQHCPKGYCRSTGDNLQIDSCAERREGRLCGRCRSGYSEAWFSTLCVPNNVCGPVWLYVLTTTLGVLYALFLMFQADVKKFIFSGSFCRNCWPSKNAQSTPTMDHQNKDPSSYPSSSLMMTFWRRQERGEQRIELTKMDDYTTPTVYSHFNYASAPATDDDESANNGLLLLPVTSSNARDFRHHTSDKMTQKIDGAAATTTTTDRESQVEVSIAVDYGCIVILVYYLQDSQLLNVKTVYTVPSTQLQFIARSVIAVLFRFELDVFELLHETCAIPDMTPVPKLASQALLVPFIMIVFVVIHTAGRILRWLGCRDRTTSGSQTGRQPRSVATDGTSSTLDVKLASGFITTLLFMYQKMGTTTFVVLNCVPVDNVSVLFVDGTVTCYAHWQYVVLAYAAVCVTPFCIVLLVAPSMLRRRQLSVVTFFAACLCPLPFLVVWLIRHLWRYAHPPPMPSGEPPEPLDPGTLAVLGILQGPFNDNRYGLCWAGVLIGRRLVLILLFTFVNDPLVRLLAMLLFCFVVLLHHVDVQPYRHRVGNVAGTFSATALVTLGTVNLVRYIYPA